MRRVYVDMVADLFHYGHAAFLKQARMFGDHLIVGVHADDIVESYKRAPILTMKERIASVEACRYVDQVIPNAPLIVSQDWIEIHDIHLVVHGDDMSKEQLKILYGVPMEMGIFRTVQYTPGISTSGIIERIVDRFA